MATLILRNSDGFEVGRRDMHPSERLEVYRAKMDGEPIVFGGAWYRVVTVAWRVPQEECIASVEFKTWAVAETPCKC